MKKRIWGIVGVVIVILAGVFLLSAHKCPSWVPETTLSINDTPLYVSVADTQAKRQQGLSDTLQIPKDGMLFVFEDEQIPKFWMKDMHYPIDIVWIDKKGVVVGVEKNISPQTYPNSFSPAVPVTYVLELSANRAEKLGINAGVAFYGFSKNSRLHFFGTCEAIDK